MIYLIYSILLFLLAILPIVLLGSYVYFKDQEKEPKRLLLKLFIGGVLASILTIILSIGMRNLFPLFLKDYTTYNQIELFLYAFVIVGLIEEVSKWILLYLFSYHHKEFDQIYDMIVYAVFTALGFAFIENLLYVYDGGFLVAIVRLFLAVPGHVSMSIFMGYYLSLAKQSELKNHSSKKRKYLTLSILVPSILHGIYDYFILSSHFLLLFAFLIFIITLFYMANKRLVMVSSINMDLEKKSS